MKAFLDLRYEVKSLRQKEAPRGPASAICDYFIIKAICPAVQT